MTRGGTEAGETVNKASKGFRCSECHGDLLVVDYRSTDASRREEHECRDCGKIGSYSNSHDPNNPTLEGVTERVRNLSADGGSYVDTETRQ